VSYNYTTSWSPARLSLLKLQDEILTTILPKMNVLSFNKSKLVVLLQDLLGSIRLTGAVSQDIQFKDNDARCHSTPMREVFAACHLVTCSVNKLFSRQRAHVVLSDAEQDPAKPAPPFSSPETSSPALQISVKSEHAAFELLQFQLVLLALLSTSFRNPRSVARLLLFARLHRMRVIPAAFFMEAGMERSCLS
jgi:hypothetical protein